MTQYTDTQLRDALLAAAREEFGAAWDGGEPMDPTPGFAAWEGDFLARCAAARPVGRRGRHWGRVVLAAAAVLAVLAGTVLAAAPWIQNAILQMSGESVDFIYTPAETETLPLGDWRPAWLPEGLVLRSVQEETGNGGMVVYDDGEAAAEPEDRCTYLSLWYDALDETFEVRTSTQTDLTAAEITVNDCPGYLWTDGQAYHHLTWIDEASQVGFSLIYLGPSSEEALQVAESIHLFQENDSPSK